MGSACCTRSHVLPISKQQCTICTEYTKDTDPRLPCDHIYCIACLQELFRKSMQDETLMPPRCCGTTIPTDLARLTPKEIEDFEAKKLEYSTKDRLYCSQPTCSAFIPPALIVNGIGTCPKPDCRKTTCSTCKAASHGTLDCPNDEATAAVLELARNAGWARCPQCRTMIELTHGCFHMTCRCGAQFCYLCSVAWKHCQCPQWDEARLVEEATIRVDRIARLRLQEFLAENIDTIRQNITDQLRNDHNCRHRNLWAWTPGGGICDECSDYLPLFLFRCRRCHFMVCRRCRWNRL